MKINCKACHLNFLVAEADLIFYQKVSPTIHDQQFLIPAPEHCPECRQKQRLRFRNERNLYARKCDLCKKDILAIYPPDTSFPVYCPECWWSDRWHTEGLEYNPQQSIIEHIAQLFQQTPRMSLINRNSENSTYAHDAEHNKNCYLVFTTVNSEDSLYITDSGNMKNCLDCYWSIRCELCYDLISSAECYQTFFSVHCYQVNFSYFCYDSQNCSNCFGCFHVKHKEYCIFNEQYSKEEYEKKLADLKEKLKTWQGYKEVWLQVKAFWHKQAHQYATISDGENCTGDFIVDSKNCFEAYNVVNCIDGKFLYDCVSIKDAYDCNVCGRAELMYQCQSCTGQMMLFSSFSFNCTNMYYSDHCFNCTNCFGCVGVRHQEYCIFNQQYTKEAYEKMAAQIIQQAITEKLWGSFFPAQLSPIAKQDCVINFYFPPADEVLIKDIIQQYASDPVVKNSVINCSACQKDFRLVQQELDFYEKHSLPIPPICSACRHKRRMQQRNPRKLNDRKCMQCNQAVASTFPPSSSTTIYCQQCYEKDGL